MPDTEADENERPRALLVDGHSVIFSIPELQALARRRPGHARQELVRRLAMYQDASDVQVVVVFDAAGRQGPRERLPPALPAEPKVIYAETGRTADDVIEGLVRRFHEEAELVVATRDRAEADVVAGWGAIPISPRTLWELLESEDRQFQARLDRILRRD